MHTEPEATNLKGTDETGILKIKARNARVETGTLLQGLGLQNQARS